MFCAKCGSEISEGAKFCLTCGAPSPVAPSSMPEPMGIPDTPAPMNGPAVMGGPMGGPAPMPGPAPTPMGGPAPMPGPAPTPMGGPAPMPGSSPMPGSAPFEPNGGYGVPPYGGQRAPYGYPPQPKTESLSIKVIKSAFAVIAKKPFLLWGLSLLSGLITIVASILGGPVLGVGVVVGWVMSLGMEWVYLAGLRGEEVNAKQLFAGFKDFWRAFSGMAWRDLWLLLWSLIPGAGMVFAVIKGYAYLLTPFLLRDNPDMHPFDVLKDSMAKTNGYKGKMFLTDLLVAGVCCGGFLVIGLLSAIPFVGVLFRIIMVILVIAVIIFLPLFSGLVRAAWYEEITKG